MDVRGTSDLDVRGTPHRSEAVYSHRHTPPTLPTDTPVRFRHISPLNSQPDPSRRRRCSPSLVAAPVSLSDIVQRPRAGCRLHASIPRASPRACGAALYTHSLTSHHTIRVANFMSQLSLSGIANTPSHIQANPNYAIRSLALSQPPQQGAVVSTFMQGRPSLALSQPPQPGAE